MVCTGVANAKQSIGLAGGAEDAIMGAGAGAALTSMRDFDCRNRLCPLYVRAMDNCTEATDTDDSSVSEVLS